MIHYKSYNILNKQSYSIGDFSIVPIRFKDRYKIMKWRNEQLYHLRQSETLTKEKQDNYFKNIVSKLFIQKYPDQILFSFLKNDICIGYGGLVHINWIDKNAEISFLMDTQLEKEYFTNYWSLYLQLIESIAFKELSLHKIFTYAFDLRPKLFKLLELSGYRNDAVLPQHVYFQGSFKDVKIHSKIINNEWFRRANLYDVELTYSWANNQNIRKYSFNSTPITYEEHKKWFYSKVKSKKCYYFIYENGEDIIGSIRFDIKEGNAIISYLVDVNMQGKGYGKRILEEGITVFENQFEQMINIVGYVKQDNLASIKIFNRLGFNKIKEKNYFKFEMILNI